MDNSFDKNKYDAQYVKDHYKRLSIQVPKDYFDNVLSVAIEVSGMSVNKFVKAAIDRYIQDNGWNDLTIN